MISRTLHFIPSFAFTTLLVAGSLSLSMAAPLVFNGTPPANDLQGQFEARIQFAQSQIVPAHPKEGDRQPHLIGNRDALLLVRPLNADDSTSLTVTVGDSGGNVLGTAKLAPPTDLPTTAYHIDGMPAGGADFKPKSESVAHVRDGGDLNKLGDPKSAYLTQLLAKNDLVTIETADGSWVGEIHLPETVGEGKVVEIKSQAGYSSTVYHSGRQVGISRGQSMKFQFLGKQWIRDGEAELNHLGYAEHTWSTNLPARFIKPGLTLTFKQGSASGKLAGLAVGAPTELLIHTIDIGMLVTPRGQFAFAKDPGAHREYFQTVPVSRMIVGNYEPLTLDRVMLPDGVLLTDVDPSKGGWHEGTIRQVIGKELVSIGIDNANYGINSTAGRGEDTHPYYAAQLAAHNNRGKYSNGIQVHGGSGGGGIVTLDNSLGNEFSHEVGHNYGLGHYVDGFRGSVHRSADNINSTWGWDAGKNRFIPNFYPTRGGGKACLDKQCQEPFNGQHQFGMDPMAGGSPFSGFNRFTMYTPNSAAIIQEFLESKVVFDASSPTGFRKWNRESERMEPWRNTMKTTIETNASVRDLGKGRLDALLANSDIVRIGMSDGAWTKEIHIPAASAANSGRAIAIRHGAGYSSVLFINGEQVNVSRGFDKTYISDGAKWVEKAFEPQVVERKPQAFGVPVVTLIGYYDPQGELPGTIYPALRGSYGYCYAPDGDAIRKTDCYLEVKTGKGNLRYRLAPARLRNDVMNKFHINVPASVNPSDVAIVREGKLLDRKPIARATAKPAFTVNGASPAN